MEPEGLPLTPPAKDQDVHPEPDLVNLRTIMQNQAEHCTTFKASGSIEILVPDAIGGFTSVIVRSAAPIEITTAIKADIQPAGAFPEEFARGWNKLPNELKMKILAFNLTFDKPIPSYQAWSEPEYGYSELFKHLQITPEIANLSRQVFHSTNTFLIHFSTHHSFIYPPCPMNNAIRRLEIFSTMLEIPWDCLKNLSQGDYGFGNLRTLKIMIEWDMVLYFKYDLQCLLGEIRNSGGWRDVEFSCEGEIVFDIPQWVDEEDSTDLLEEVKDAIKDHIRFNGKY